MGRSEGLISVTVIAMILIVVGSLLLLSVIDFSLNAANRGFSLFIVWLVVLGAVHVTSGIAIFRGYDWVRIFFICSMPVLVVMDWLLFHRLRRVKLDIFLLIEYLAFLFFLVGPKAPSSLKHRSRRH